MDILYGLKYHKTVWNAQWDENLIKEHYKQTARVSKKRLMPGHSFFCHSLTERHSQKYNINFINQSKEMNTRTNLYLLQFLLTPFLGKEQSSKHVARGIQMVENCTIVQKIYVLVYI